MPVRRSIDDLPAAQKPSRPPSKNNIVVNHIANRWYEQYLATSEYRPAIPSRRFRASAASLRCDRSLYYALTDVPESDPPTIADSWRMALGSMVHQAMDDSLTHLGDGWRTEVIVDLEPIGVDGSAHADLVQFVCVDCGAPIAMLEIVDSDSTGWQQWACRCSNECDASEPFEIVRTAAGEHTWSPAHEQAAFVTELKSLGGFQFKNKATSFKGPPEGPQYGHIVQGAIAADALGCNNLIVAYLSMELVGADLAKAYCDDELGRFAAEWHFAVDRMRPILDREYARINRLLRAVDADTLPARELHDQDIPVGAFIMNPATGAWATRDDHGQLAQTGSTWFCAYCRHRQTCVSDGADVASVEVQL